MNLTKEEFWGKKFKWTDEVENSFTKLKTLLTTIPILQHFAPHLLTIMETDASDFTICVILSKLEDGKLEPVAFHSRKWTNARLPMKEILAIISKFKKWWWYLESAHYIVTVFSNHKNLEYFVITKVLNQRQARWAQ
jgi:hypothetical protein